MKQERINQLTQQCIICKETFHVFLRGADACASEFTICPECIQELRSIIAERNAERLNKASEKDDFTSGMVQDKVLYSIHRDHVRIATGNGDTVTISPAALCGLNAVLCNFILKGQHIQDGVITA